MSHPPGTAMGSCESELENQDSIPLYYWDGKKNFGDLIAPWLISMMTGKATHNVKGRSRETALASVGSIITMIDRPGLHIWGSGAIRPLQPEHIHRLSNARPAAIHAVRGWKTYKELTSKLGWKVPKIYGDPALLLPRFFSPKTLPYSGPIVVCPHYSHRGLFDQMTDENLQVADVMQDPESVVNQIVNSRACISTSLHGLIVAQAYEVPWFWLEIEGHKLSGTNFKFEDFFTVIDRETVQSVKFAIGDIESRSLKKLALRASVPKSKFNFDALYDAFPLCNQLPT